MKHFDTLQICSLALSSACFHSLFSRPLSTTYVLFCAFVCVSMSFCDCILYLSVGFGVLLHYLI